MLRVHEMIFYLLNLQVVSESGAHVAVGFTTSSREEENAPLISEECVSVPDGADEMGAAVQ